jgi:hypothetical protein
MRAGFALRGDPERIGDWMRLKPRRPATDARRPAMVQN